MHYIVCNSHFHKVLFQASLLYLLNIHTKDKNLDYILVFISAKRQKRRENRKAEHRKNRIQINFRQFQNSEMRWGVVICLFIFI